MIPVDDGKNLCRLAADRFAKSAGTSQQHLFLLSPRAGIGVPGIHNDAAQFAAAEYARARF